MNHEHTSNSEMRNWWCESFKYQLSFLEEASSCPNNDGGGQQQATWGNPGNGECGIWNRGRGKQFYFPLPQKYELASHICLRHCQVRSPTSPGPSWWLHAVHNIGLFFYVVVFLLKEDHLIYEIWDIIYIFWEWVINIHILSVFGQHKCTYIYVYILYICLLCNAKCCHSLKTLLACSWAEVFFSEEPASCCLFELVFWREPDRSEFTETVLSWCCQLKWLSHVVRVIMVFTSLPELMHVVS